MMDPNIVLITQLGNGRLMIIQVLEINIILKVIAIEGFLNIVLALAQLTKVRVNHLYQDQVLKKNILQYLISHQHL